MITNDPERAICGIATCFGVPSRDGDIWTAENFDLVTGLELPVPLRVDHGILVGRWGFVDNVGTVSRFAKIDYPISGLLVLGQVDFAHGFGDSILHDLRLTLQQRYMPPVWGFSVGGWQDPDTGEVVLKEVSLSRRQAYADARALEIGPDAIALFDMLTEKRPAGRR
jgi:hypothetical protein